MQNNIITKISPSVRIFVLIILTLILFFTRSIYLILFITNLTIILFLTTDKKVNLYVNMLKKIVILLLIFLVACIIIFRYYNIISILTLLYKLMVITFLIEIFILNIDFRSLHEGLYRFFLPLKKTNINIEKISFDIVLSLYFIKYFIDSKEEINKIQERCGRKKVNLKNNLLPRIIYSVNMLTELQENLKIKFYKINRKKVDIKSKVILLFAILLFITFMFKEVVL